MISSRGLRLISRSSSSNHEILETPGVIQRRRVRRISTSDSENSNCSLFKVKPKFQMKIISNASEDEENLVTKSRKRCRKKSKWVRNIQRRNRIKGLQYKTRKGVIMAAKEFLNIPCRCARNCCGKVTTQERKKAMDSFYNLKTENEQNIILKGLCMYIMLKEDKH